MKKALKILICLALIAMAAFACIKDISISNQAETAYEQIIQSSDNKSDEAIKALSDYESVKNDRFINFTAMAVCYLIVWRLVVFAGKRKKIHAKLTQEEARKMAQDITTELEMKGQIVDASSDDFEDGSDIKSLDEPTVTEVVFKRRGVNITWNPVENADGYYVLKRADEGLFKRWKKMQENETRAVDYRVESNHTYRYSVMAFHNNGDDMILSSFNRETKELFIENGNMLPYPKLQVEEKDEKKIIKWTKVDGAALYLVFRKEEGSIWKKIERVNADNACEFTDNEAEKGKEYTYSVISVCFVFGFAVRGVFNDDGIKIRY